MTERFAPSKLPHIHIEPPPGWMNLGLRELWAYRELIYFLIWRDIKVRYKQTALGAAWAVLQPVLTMVVFSVFFGWFAQMPSDGVPYPLFSYAGLLPWQLFAYALSESGNSLINNQRLITRVFFPRLAAPLAAVLAGLVDFGIAMTVLFGMMIFYGVIPSWRLLALPFFLLLALASALAAGLWLSALNVNYRDVRYMIPFITQLWLFITPIAYPSSMLPNWLLPIYFLNPMAGVVEGFRWSLLGTDIALGGWIWLSAVVVVIFLAGGVIYFKRMEATFADKL